MKWLSKKGIKDQYPGIIYDHVSSPSKQTSGHLAFVTITNVSVELTDVCDLLFSCVTI